MEFHLSISDKCITSLECAKEQPLHTVSSLSKSDDQTAGPHMLLFSEKLVKAPWDDPLFLAF